MTIDAYPAREIDTCQCLVHTGQVPTPAATKDQPALSLLRVGMSVETTIDTRAPQQTQLVDDQRTSEIKGMGE